MVVQEELDRIEEDIKIQLAELRKRVSVLEESQQQRQRKNTPVLCAQLSAFLESGTGNMSTQDVRLSLDLEYREQALRIMRRLADAQPARFVFSQVAGTSTIRLRNIRQRNIRNNVRNVTPPKSR